MSSTEEIEVKAGHPPAMKVGGVRIPQRRRSAEEKEGTPPKPRKDSENDEEDDEEQLVAKSPPRAPIVVSGVVGKVDRDFPTAAVKHTHEKPVPTHEVRTAHNTKPPVIQQPRK
ncbi:death-associated protein 1 homolog [Procambarus clarkii]|uniref:death-associated protein 1 homolog n=1 Tax=Procambarus clarkii TaxID=6728 RepID=UPI001E676D40|nr:death-associated protein 1-like [Procambarus clarkii]